MCMQYPNINVSRQILHKPMPTQISTNDQILAPKEIPKALLEKYTNTQDLEKQGIHQSNSTNNIRSTLMFIQLFIIFILVATVFTFYLSKDFIDSLNKVFVKICHEEDTP